MRLPNAPFPTPPGVVYRSGRSRGHCPRCHVFIVPTSRVVRLAQSEHPNATPDGRRSADTGAYYTWDHRSISRKPKWFVHERCYREHYGAPSLPPEVEAACATAYKTIVDDEVERLSSLTSDCEGLMGADADALLTQLDGDSL